jgi:hypothetical protein
MPFGCSVIAAFLCISANVDNLTSQASLSATIEARSKDFSAQAHISDAVETYDAARMNRTCVEDYCISYHKYCEGRPGRVTCHYAFVRPDYRGNETLVVSSRDASRMKRAEEQLGIIFDVEGRPRFFQLSLLAQVSPSASPPQCPDRKSPKPCGGHDLK